MPVKVMNMQRTIKVKVDCPLEIGLETIRLAAEVFSLHVEAGLAAKTYNKLKLHHLCYREARMRFPNLQSSVIQTIRDTASEALKALKLGRRPKKRKYSALRYNLRTFSVRGDTVSFSLIGGRHRSQVVVPEFQQPIWRNGKPQAATLCFDGKQFWLHVVFQVPDIEPLPEGEVLGVDRGLLNLAVSSDGRFFSSKRVRAYQRRMLFNKRGLQSKRHSRSARRRLKKTRRREQRFQRDVNHCVTKKIVATAATVFVLEDLSKIRVKSRRKGRNWNQRFNRWAFFQFEQFLRYKAAAVGKRVELVDARYTSQICSVCGTIGMRHRSQFSCPRCGHREHSDLNAAKNIRNRYLSTSTASRDGVAGSVVNLPNARGVEVEAVVKHGIEMEPHEQAASACLRGC